MMAMRSPILRLLAAAVAFIAASGALAAGKVEFTTGAAGDYVIQLSGVGSMTGSYGFRAEGTAAGNNVYYVTHSAAVILERTGEGFDTVESSVSYALQADASVEQLRTNLNYSKSSINLTGNDFAQAIIGNAGSNIIDGKGGADEIWGLNGKDMFVFSSPLGPSNVDRIYDFNVRDDTIRLDDAVFQGLATGGLAAGAFAKGTGAADASDRIIYDPVTGNLYFDPDGIGGIAQTLFATLSSGLKITAADFLVV